MTFKEYIPLKDSPKRMEYSLFLKLEKDKIPQMLIHSLVFDGRFYGAESHEQRDDEFSQYLGWVYYTKYNGFKSLIESEQSQRSLN
jgi:hypothetical protein